jgi:hypothetical protein
MCVELLRAGVDAVTVRSGAVVWQFWLFPRCSARQVRLYSTSWDGIACRVCAGLRYRSARALRWPVSLELIAELMER